MLAVICGRWASCCTRWRLVSARSAARIVRAERGDPRQTSGHGTRLVPLGLQTIIRRCLSKGAHDRYQHAGEVRAALEAVQSDR